MIFLSEPLTQRNGQLPWLTPSHKINGLKICKSKELRVCCTHSPKTQAKSFSIFLAWMWSAVCAPHIINGSEMNNGQKMNDQKYFYIFKLMHLVFWLQPRSLGPEIIPTNSFHLVASCNPVEKLVLICKPRPPRSKQRELIRPKIECVHLLRVMAEGKGAAKK